MTPRLARLHYVPKFYLEEFTDPDTPVGHEPYVWVFEKVGGNWKKRAPKNVAAESDFYVLTHRSGRRHTGVEEALGVLESAAARLLRRKVFRERLLKRYERFELAAFVVAMLNRVPAEVENIREFMREVGRVHLKAMLEHFKEDPHALEVMTEQYRRDTGKEISVDPEALDPSLYSVDVEHASAAAIALASLGEVSALVASMGWTFWISRADRYFVTSDFPVGVIDPVTGRHPVGLHPKHFPYVELTIPLSRSIALAAGWASYDTVRFMEASAAVVEEINVRTAMRATTIYAPILTFPGQGLLITGEGCWASAPQPKPSVRSIPTEDGQLIGVSMPHPWLPRRRLRRITLE